VGIVPGVSQPRSAAETRFHREVPCPSAEGGAGNALAEGARPAGTRPEAKSAGSSGWESFPARGPRGRARGSRCLRAGIVFRGWGSFPALRNCSRRAGIAEGARESFPSRGGALRSGCAGGRSGCGEARAGGTPAQREVPLRKRREPPPSVGGGDLAFRRRLCGGKPGAPAGNRAPRLEVERSRWKRGPPARRVRLADAPSCTASGRARPRGGCRSPSSRCPRAPAAPGRCAGRRRLPGGGSRRSGVACAGSSAW